jgi:AmiR/NasT family two-component response regulator
MRLRDTVIGALNLFSATSQPLAQDYVELGQALADVATIGIVHERTVRQYEAVTEQLQAALNSRIRIEQAKGVLAERMAVSVDEAFGMLREHARASEQKLSAIAQAVIDGTADIPRERPDSVS